MELLIFYGEDVLILSTGRKPDPSTALRDPMKTGSLNLSNRQLFTDPSTTLRDPAGTKDQ